MEDGLSPGVIVGHLQVILERDDKDLSHENCQGCLKVGAGLRYASSRTTWQWRIQHCAENFTPTRFCFDKKNIERKEKRRMGGKEGGRKKGKNGKGRKGKYSIIKTFPLGNNK